MKRPALKNFRRIVVKVGSSLLIDSDAGEVRASWLSAGVLSALHAISPQVFVSRADERDGRVPEPLPGGAG